MIRTVVSTANTTRQFGVGLASRVLHSCCASFHRAVCFPASSAQKPLWYFGDSVSDFREPRASREALPLHAVANRTRATRRSARLHMALPHGLIEAGLVALAGRSGASSASTVMNADSVGFSRSMRSRHGLLSGTRGRSLDGGRRVH